MVFANFLQLSAFLITEPGSADSVCIRTLSIRLLFAGAHLCPFPDFGVSFYLCSSKSKRQGDHVNKSIILTSYSKEYRCFRGCSDRECFYHWMHPFTVVFYGQRFCMVMMHPECCTLSASLKHVFSPTVTSQVQVAWN